MRFEVTTPKRALQHAKKLKRLLASYGYDFKLGWCHDLIARMLGYAHYFELLHAAGSAPPSPGDDYVDEETRIAWRNRHIEVLVAVGIDGDIATEIVNQLRPTAYGPGGSDRQPDQEFVADFEREWGLRGSNKPAFVVVERSEANRRASRHSVANATSHPVSG
jgi:hypothetical protein